MTEIDRIFAGFSVEDAWEYRLRYPELPSAVPRQIREEIAARIWAVTDERTRTKDRKIGQRKSAKAA